jgi:lipopolysaccharide export system protein LptA
MRDPDERRSGGISASGLRALDLSRTARLVFRGFSFALCVIAFVLDGTRAYSQQKDFEIRSADVLDVRRFGAHQIQALIGRVHMVQPSASGEVKIWCDSAFRNMQTNVVELFGHVKIVRDSVTLTSSEGTYSGNKRLIVMPKGILLNRGQTVLTSRYGEYWADDKVVYFRREVHVVDSTSSTWSDTLTYFEAEEKSIAVGRVRVTNPENNLTIFGDSLVHFGKAKYTIVPKNPRLMQIDTVAGGMLDTLLIVSALMEAYQDSLQRFLARGQVEMARTDFAARCGEATYFYKRDRIVLRQQPVVWSAENQISGDSIVITTKDRKLQSVYVRGRSMAVSHADSIHAARFDQLSAREITLRFRNGKIAQIDAERTATSLYYLFDGGLPNGANRSSGDQILMEFRDGKLDRIKIVGGVEGKYYPERMIAKRERAYNLDGFRWITNRPKRTQLSIVHQSYE